MPQHYAGNPAVDGYIRGVLSGSILASKWTRCAVERQVFDLTRVDTPEFPYVLDEERAQHKLDFNALCCHIEGELAGEPFDPLPFQAFVDWVVFGWVHTETRARRFAEAWIEGTRGIGKSFWAGCTCLYLTGFDGEPGAKVYSAATKEDQAAIVWGVAAEIAKQSPDLQGLFTVYDSKNNHLIRLLDEPTCILRPLGADSRTADGLNPHGVVNDEVHEHRTRKLYMKLKTAMGKRKQPLLWNITTQGTDDVETLFDELSGHAEDVLDGWQNGSFIDERFFAIKWCLDEGDDPYDERLWPKACPALGVRGSGQKLDHLRDMANRARSSPEAERDLKRMHLGIRTSSVTKAIPRDIWDACAGHPDGTPIDWASFDGDECVAAWDLSSTRDLTVVAAMFRRGKLFYVRFWCFLPAENLADRIKDDHVPYDRWAAEGWLTLTDGNQVDELEIAKCIKAIKECYRVRQYTEDPWHAVQLEHILQRECGIEVVGYRQDLKSFGAAVMHFLDEIYTGKLRHDGNPVARWAAGNAVTKEDADGNRRFHKKASRKRIDPITAASMCRGRWLVIGGEPDPAPSPYESEGLTVL